MFGIGSRTWYAIWHGIIFNFEYKKDRDYFIVHGNAEILSAKEVYNMRGFTNCIKVNCSSSLGSNEYRKSEIKKWKMRNDN